MKMKLYLALVCAVLFLAAPALVHADDGNPDTLYFVPSELDATGNDTILTLQLYAYNDANFLGGIQMGFKWETDNIEIINAVQGPAASVWNNFIFYDMFSIAKSNEMNRALFAGWHSMGMGQLQPLPTPQHMATYTFRVSDWDVNSQIIFDSTHWDDGTEMMFTTATFETYVPKWIPESGKFIIRDVNYVQCDAPIITCVDPDPITICESGEVCIDLPISGADNVEITGLANNISWANDILCFTPIASGDIVFHVTASVDCGEQSTCDINVNLTFGEAPVIECPIIAFNESICGTGEVSVPLVITGATSVDAGTAFWSNNQLLFWADASGTYIFDVTATNDEGCGDATCQVTINVTINDLPSITCPAIPIEDTVCAPGLICVELPIAGAISVDAGGASWSDDLLCFNAPTSDLYTFEIAATNDCGTVNCTIQIAVTIEGTPVITFPDGNTVDKFLCEAGEVCIDLPITGADQSSTSFGTLADDQLCFWADTAGTYSIHIEATNGCGTEGGDIIVVVAIGAAPTITCPTVPAESFLLYAGPVCTTLEILGAETVVVDNGGEWLNNELCFTADTAGTYNFTVFATSDCGADTCDMSVIVDITPPCVDIMLTDTLLYFTAFEGDVTPVPESYTVTISSSVDSIPFDFTITGIEEGMTVTPTTGNTGDAGLDVVISGDVSSLPIGLNEATLTISSVSDRVCDPKMATLDINVEIFKRPSADTVLVGRLPAVPGMQVVVPITFANSCFLSAAQIDLAWGTTEIFLDSVSYVGSAFAEFGHTTDIDNDLSTVFLRSDAFGADPVSPSAGELNLWANLHFTVSCDVTPAEYAIVQHIQPLQFERDCGEGVETDSPEFNTGYVMVDTSENYVCGWVVTPDGFGGYTEIEGAIVEMWSSFPLGTLELGSTSGHNGAFAFDEFFSTQFDLYAYADGFYPGTAPNIGFGETGVMIILHPLADFTPTDKWTDYYGEGITLLGVPMPNGSVIEAHDPQGTLCGRWVVVVPGSYGFMPVYRDDTLSVEDEGAEEGDIISFLVNGSEALTTGDVIYPGTDFGPPIDIHISAGATLTKTCVLTENWNLISWNLNTESDNVEDLLADHMDCIEVILGFENGGLTYDPDLPQFSTLWAMDHLSGYWVKVKPGCEVTLDIEGLPVLAGTPIAINKGWNLVSYLADGPLTPEVALATIHDDLIIAYGSHDGIKIYVPGEPDFNNLEEMATCYGYWIKSNAEGVLNYPSNGPIPPAEEINPLIAEAARLAPMDVSTTTSWVNLFATELTLDGEKVHAGADIAAYSSNRTKIGSFRMTSDGSFGFMPVYADDAGSNRVTGLNPGQKFSLTINDIEINETFTWTQTGDRIEITLLTSKGTGNTQLPDEYTLGQNYPNPFNPSTTITFSVPLATQAKIEVFNVLGKLVAVPFNGIANAGENSVVWDGRLTSGQTAASGVYFYRFTSDGRSETRKMMFLK